MTTNQPLPETFRIDIKRIGLLTYCLNASQVLSVTRERAFEFFKDPGNLCDITPVWLDFCMLNRESNMEVYDNAEFDYTIKWLGIRMTWRSRIVDYNPPERFTDIQIKGPYRSWVHVHTLQQIPEGTLMKDKVTYKLPLIAAVFHRFFIKKKLKDIFSYRAVKIDHWVRAYVRADDK
jgi:ligand-binding SRPBCC domain-containing protein